MNSGEVVIIGSGISALFCGAVLAHQGKKVHLFESHYNTGGYASSFKRKKSIHEVSLHSLEEVIEDSYLDEWFKKLGIDDNVKMTKAPRFATVWLEDEKYCIPYGRDAAVSYLVDRFPDDKEAITEFYDLLVAVREEKKSATVYSSAMFKEIQFPIASKYIDISLLEYCQLKFKSNDLIRIICSNFGFFHHDLGKLRMSIFLLGNSSYMLDGIKFINGTTQKLNDYLVSIIEKNNGKVFLGHYVTKINLENNNVTSIDVLKRSSQTNFNVKVDKLIYNGDPFNLKVMLKEEGHHLRTSANVSISTCSMYFEADDSFTDLGVDGYLNYFMYSNFEKEQNDIIDFVLYNMDIVDKNLSPNKHLGAILFLDSFDNWYHLTELEYQQKKEKICQRFLDAMDKRHPGFKDIVSHYELSTPMTKQRYTHNEKGAAYGFADEVGSKDSFDIDINNLYLCSAWKHGAGFYYCALGGINTAVDVLEESINSNSYLSLLKFNAVILMILIHALMYSVSMAGHIVSPRGNTTFWMMSLILGAISMSIPSIASINFSMGSMEKNKSLSAMIKLSFGLFFLDGLRDFLISGNTSSFFYFNVLGFIGLSLLLISGLNKINKYLVGIISSLLIVVSPFLYQLRSFVFLGNTQSIGNIFRGNLVLFILVGAVLIVSLVFILFREKLLKTKIFLSVLFSILTLFLFNDVYKDNIALLNLFNLPMASLIGLHQTRHFWPLAIWFPMLGFSFYFGKWILNQKHNKVILSVVFSTLYLSFYFIYAFKFTFLRYVSSNNVVTQSLFIADFYTVLAILSIGCVYYILMLVLASFWDFSKIKIISFISRWILGIYIIHMPIQYYTVGALYTNVRPDLIYIIAFLVSLIGSLAICYLLELIFFRLRVSIKLRKVK